MRIYLMRRMRFGKIWWHVNRVYAFGWLRIRIGA